MNSPQRLFGIAAHAEMSDWKKNGGKPRLIWFARNQIQLLLDKLLQYLLRYFNKRFEYRTRAFIAVTMNTFRQFGHKSMQIVHFKTSVYSYQFRK